MNLPSENVSEEGSVKLVSRILLGESGQANLPSETVRRSLSYFAHPTQYKFFVYCFLSASQGAPRRLLLLYKEVNSKFQPTHTRQWLTEGSSGTLVHCG